MARKEKQDVEEPVDSLTDLDILQELLIIQYDKLKDSESEVKIGDILKIIELKHKLQMASGGDAEKTFWKLIEGLRREELSKKEPAIKSRTLSQKGVKK